MIEKLSSEIKLIFVYQKKAPLSSGKVNTFSALKLTHFIQIIYMKSTPSPIQEE